jgi:hypothetical protein
MGTYGAPFASRGWVAVVTALSAAWNVVVVTAALGGGEGVFSVPSALFSVATFAITTYWSLCRTACRVTLRAGILEWQAPVRIETMWLTDIAAIRSVPLLPHLAAIRRRRGGPLLVMVGKGLAALVDEVKRQQPDIVAALGPWSRVSERMPGESWWRPGRHYRCAGPTSPLAPWPLPAGREPAMVTEVARPVRPVGDGAGGRPRGPARAVRVGSP